MIKKINCDELDPLKELDSAYDIKGYDDLIKFLIKDSENKNIKNDPSGVLKNE